MATLPGLLRVAADLCLGQVAAHDRLCVLSKVARAVSPSHHDVLVQLSLEFMLLLQLKVPFPVLVPLEQFFVLHVP